MELFNKVPEDLILFSFAKRKNEPIYPCIVIGIYQGRFRSKQRFLNLGGK